MVLTSGGPNGLRGSGKISVGTQYGVVIESKLSVRGHPIPPKLLKIKKRIESFREITISERAEVVLMKRSSLKIVKITRFLHRDGSRVKDS